MANHVENLYNYHVWANQRIIDHLKTLSPEKYQKEMKSVFPSVSKVYLISIWWNMDGLIPSRVRV